MDASTQDAFGTPPQFDWLPVDSLVIDPRYQREIKAGGQKLVKRIARDFRWDKFLALTVSGPDKIGDYQVIDGQHRLSAAQKVGLERVPCLVVGAGGVEDQARSFKAINKDRVGVTRIDTFWADVAAGDPEAQAVKALCDRCGVVISKTGTGRQKPLHTVAVAAISTLAKLHEPSLVVALETLVAAQGEAENAFRAQTIKALTHLLALNADRQLERARLERALADLDLDDEIAHAKAARSTFGNSTERALQARLTNAYNKGLSQPARLAGPVQ